jgi:pimeloyl-ACP methyl ester carboxylesterase
MKHRLAYAIATAVATAVVAGIVVGVPATSAQASPAKTATSTGCDLNPAPPIGFTEHKVSVNGIGINYVRGGHGPTLLLIHGYPESWYEWEPILPALAQHYTVIAPDLPGAGNSDAPAAEADYTKKAMAADLYDLMAKLGLSHNISIVGHDIGTMVAYSYGAAHRGDVRRLVLSEAPIPDQSIFTYPALTKDGPGLWWFGLFNDPNNLAYQMFSGKEKQWVFGSIPVLEVVKNSITQCDLALFTHYLREPGHLQATIDWFSTFGQDIQNDAVYQQTKLTMPVLAIGGAESLKDSVPTQVAQYATNVTGIVMKDTGHWLYEERPAETTALLLHFLG